MGSVLAYKDLLKIPTYELSYDDLNPTFEEHRNPYPYTMKGKRSNVKEEKVYEVFILENDFLKLTVIPSLGGRLYSVYDKVKLREMFYKNEVIKPRKLGYRGAWISGGIEFNFPVSHSPTTIDRVNCSIINYEDGSASIVFGNIELFSAMNWSVELRLYPEKAYIEENVKLYNPTAYENNFYFWTNAAADYNNNIKLIYPFDWCSNNFSDQYIKWPYFEGIDCTKVADMPIAYETFGKLLTDNFFGIYDFEKNYGIVHYANRKKLKGAKYFTWGNDNMGDSWRIALTDNRSEYFEIQSGLFETQSVYKFLKPHQELEWSEYWYPVADISGFKYAEKELALNFEIVNDGIEFTFYALEELKDCTIVLNVSGKEFKLNKTLSSCTPIKVEFSLQGVKKPIFDFNLEVYNVEKSILSMGNRNEFMDDYPSRELFEEAKLLADVNIGDELLTEGIRQESLRNIEKAVMLYKSYLETYPISTTALNRLGRLYLKMDMPIDAEECFRKVLKHDYRNSEARFLLAKILKDNGEIKRARKLVEDIPYGEEYYNASVVELVKMDITLGYFKEALELLKNNKLVNSYCAFLESICHRKSSYRVKLPEIIDSRINNDVFIYAERYMTNPLEENRKLLCEYTDGDERVLLHIALHYIDLELYEDADMVLDCSKNPGIKTKFVKLFIKYKTGEKDLRLVQDIVQSSLDYAFVNENKVCSIIKEMAEVYDEIDSSGKADYLVGNFYYSKDRKDEALKHFEAAYNKGLKYTVLLFNLGYIYHSYLKNVAKAIYYLEENLRLNGWKNEKALVLLDNVYKETINVEGRKMLVPYMKQAHNRSLVLIPMIEILRATGNEEEALKLVYTEEFENWEGKEFSGPCYRDCVISVAMKELSGGNIQKAKEYIETVNIYPTGLNYGEPSNMSQSKINYYKGIIYSLSGEEVKSMEEFKQGICEIDNKRIRHNEESKRYSYLCLKELNKYN